MVSSTIISFRGMGESGIWYALVISVLGKPRQEYQKFKVIFSYVLETCLKKKFQVFSGFCCKLYRVDLQFDSKHTSQVKITGFLYKVLLL